MSEIAGIVEHWDDKKGFGFIAAEQGKKYFFHISVVRGAFRPQQGERVLFQAGSDDKGRLTAKHVRSEQLTIDNPSIRAKPKSTTARQYVQPEAKPEAKLRLHEKAIPWTFVILLSLLPVAGALQLAIDHQSYWVLVAYIVLSILTYYFYWDDKRRAKRSEWRIPEANLHFWALIGGWPGAFIAQQQYRHKTKKLSFQFVFWGIVIAHQLLWFDWLFMSGKWLMLLFG